MRPRRWRTRRCASCSTLARQLRPTALDDLGLTAAIAGQVEQIARPGLETALDADGDFSDLDDDVQLVIYRVAQEALSNAARHSDADRIAVSLRRSGDGVELEVADDGRGFAFEQSERGLGIGGMRERALLVGAELTIESRPDQGTTVRLEVSPPPPDAAASRSDRPSNSDSSGGSDGEPGVGGER